jgi:hypothetical protein
VQTTIEKDGLTRQSFADECDVNRIVDTYARTGIVNHLPRTPPVYGDCPDQTLFEAACIQAEIRSSEEDAALNPPSEAVSASESDDQEQTGTEVRETEIAPVSGSEAPQAASEGES